MPIWGALSLKKVEELEKYARNEVNLICYSQNTQLVDRYVNHLFEVEMHRRKNAPTEATEAFRRCRYVLVLKGQSVWRAS